MQDTRRTQPTQLNIKFFRHPLCNDDSFLVKDNYCLTVEMIGGRPLFQPANIDGRENTIPQKTSCRDGIS